VPIHDVGYRQGQPPKGHPWLRWLVIAEAGIRLAWKSSWLRRMLFFAWMPTAFFGFCFFMYEQSFKNPEARVAVARLLQRLPEDISPYQNWQMDPNEARHEVWAFLLMGFFRYPQGILMVMLVGLIAPSLISQDFRSKAFLLYFSRPITPIDYVIGKAAVVAVYLSAITLLPALLLYAIGVMLSPDFSVVLATWDLPLRVVLASITLTIPTTVLALFLSSMTTESRYAGFAWFAIWAMGWVAYANLLRIGAGPQWSMLSLYHLLGRVQLWIFGLPAQDVSAAAIMLLMVTVVSFIVLMTRISAPMRM
jgi:ABC-2 type transport system permease protein